MELQYFLSISSIPLIIKDFHGVKHISPSLVKRHRSHISNKNEMEKSSQLSAVDNLKRVIVKNDDWTQENAQGISFISSFQEIKTTWHPIEQIGGATSSY